MELIYSTNFVTRARIGELMQSNYESFNLFIISNNKRAIYGYNYYRSRIINCIRIIKDALRNHGIKEIETRQDVSNDICYFP